MRVFIRKIKLRVFFVIILLKKGGNKMKWGATNN